MLWNNLWSNPKHQLERVIKNTSGQRSEHRVVARETLRIQCTAPEPRDGDKGAATGGCTMPPGLPERVDDACLRRMIGPS